MNSLDTSKIVSLPPAERSDLVKSYCANALSADSRPMDDKEITEALQSSLTKCPKLNDTLTIRALSALISWLKRKGTFAPPPVFFAMASRQYRDAQGEYVFGEFLDDSEPNEQNCGFDFFSSENISNVIYSWSSEVTPDTVARCFSMLAIYVVRYVFYPPDAYSLSRVSSAISRMLELTTSFPDINFEVTWQDMDKILITPGSPGTKNIVGAIVLKYIKLNDHDPLAEILRNCLLIELEWHDMSLYQIYYQALKTMFITDTKLMDAFSSKIGGEGMKLLLCWFHLAKNDPKLKAFPWTRFLFPGAMNALDIADVKEGIIVMRLLAGIPPESVFSKMTLSSSAQSYIDQANSILHLMYPDRRRIKFSNEISDSESE